MPDEMRREGCEKTKVVMPDARFHPDEQRIEPPAYSLRAFCQINKATEHRDDIIARWHSRLNICPTESGDRKVNENLVQLRNNPVEFIMFKKVPGIFCPDDECMDIVLSDFLDFIRKLVGEPRDKVGAA
jgi:hypothetical protein